MPENDPFSSDDLTDQERNAEALAEADVEMLTALVRIRREKGLTQEDVAKALGRDKSTVSRFERLDSDPRLSTVRRYAGAVGALIKHNVWHFQPQWQSDTLGASIMGFSGTQFASFHGTYHVDLSTLTGTLIQSHVVLPGGSWPAETAPGPLDEGDTSSAEEPQAPTFVYSR